MILFAYFPANRESFSGNFFELQCRNLSGLLDAAVDAERDDKFVMPIANGPDGKSGGLAAISADPIECDLEAATFKPERCEWYQTGNNWIGWIKGHKPGPEDLRRKILHPGIDTTLGDGNRWKVPLAAFLPRLNHRNDQGEVVDEEVLPPFHTLHRLAHELRAFLTVNADECSKAACEGTLQLPGSITLVEGLLGANYRYAPDLYDRLGLWTPDCLVDAVLSITGIRLAADEEYRRRRERREFTSNN